MAVLGILTSLVAWLYHPVLAGLARQWWGEPDYSHGFLVPVLSAYVVWQQRHRLRALSDRPSGWGLPVLVAGVGLLLVGTVAAELYAARVSLLVIVIGLILYLLGRQHLKLLAFPILFLGFMIPPPAIVFNAVTFPLQLFAASTAAASLNLLAIPVLREGNLIALAHATLEVAEACSGIRSLVTLLALAMAYACFTQRRVWPRVVLVLSAVPIAIVTNAARVVGTGVLAHFFGAEAAQGFFHTFSGWLVFLAAFALLFAEGALLKAMGEGGRLAVAREAARAV